MEPHKIKVGTSPPLFCSYAFVFNVSHITTKNNFIFDSWHLTAGNKSVIFGGHMPVVENKLLFSMACKCPPEISLLQAITLVSNSSSSGTLLLPLAFAILVVILYDVVSHATCTPLPSPMCATVPSPSTPHAHAPSTGTCSPAFPCVVVHVHTFSHPCARPLLSLPVILAPVAHRLRGSVHVVVPSISHNIVTPVPYIYAVMPLHPPYRSKPTSAAAASSSLGLFFNY